MSNHPALRLLARWSGFLIVSCAVAAPASRAASPGNPSSVPPSLNWTVPPCISLVGSDGHLASPIGAFEVVIRDLANNPMPGVEVTVEVSNATDIHLCAQQLDPGVVMDCPNGRARATTDANGVARFTLLGGSNGAGNASTLLNGGRIYAFGVLGGTPTVSAYDLDGESGVGSNDLSAWLGDFGSGVAYGRADYDCSGALGANDFSLWLTAFGAGNQVASCAAACP
jgi:hypothetical protein